MRKSLLLAAVLAVGPCLAARADIIPIEGGISGSAPYTWSYAATVTSDETANPGPARPR